TNYSIVFPAGKKILFANQLDHSGGNDLDNLFPVEPFGTTVFVWLAPGYAASSYDTDANQWDVDFVINPGGGAFYFSTVTVTNYFTGAPHTPALPVSLNPGQKYLLSDQTLEVGTWE